MNPPQLSTVDSWHLLKALVFIRESLKKFLFGCIQNFHRSIVLHALDVAERTKLMNTHINTHTHTITAT